MADLTGLTREQLLERKDLLTRRQQLIEQGGGLPTKATPDQYLSTKERGLGGFKSFTGLQSDLEQRRSELGLASGTPLEPVGFNMENLKDFPNDIVDMIGPAFPAVGQFLGSLVGATGGPGGIVAGGTAGAFGGELLRQLIGEHALGFDQGTVGERVGRLALETGTAALGEGAAIGINKAIQATKGGLLKAANNLLSKKGVDGFTRVMGKIFRNVDFPQTQYALNAIRQGDRNVLSSVFANPDFANDFSSKLLFGKGGLGKHIQQLARNKKGGDVAIKSLFKEFLGFSDDITETIISKGSAIEMFTDPRNILKFGDNIAKASTGLIDDVGKQLEKARLQLAKSAPNAPVDLTDVNNSIVRKLVDVDFLRTVEGMPNVFQINQKFAATSTGKAQGRMFNDLVERFFKKVDLTKANIDKLQASALGGNLQAIKQLDKIRTSGAKTNIGFIANNNMKFSKFVRKLSNIDAQISGAEFEALGKLSPEFTVYLRGLREIPKGIAESVDNTLVPRLTSKFSELAETLKPLREAIATNNKEGVESYLRSLTSKGALETTLQNADDIHRVLRTKGVDFWGGIKSFKAAQAIKAYDDPLVKANAMKKMVGLVRGSFSDDLSPTMIAIRESVDPFLPQDLKIFYNARTHVVARNLYKDATSLLKGRFIANAVPVAPAIGAITGMTLGGPLGSGIGLGVGLLAQNPKLFRTVLQAAARGGGKQIAAGATKQIPRGGVVGGTQLLKSLLAQTQR